MEEAAAAYSAEILSGAPDEQLRLEHTMELPVVE